MNSLMKLEKKGECVRYISKDGEILFSVNDVVALSGIKAVAKWIARNKEKYGNNLQTMRVSQITKAGKRTFRMNFCNSKTCIQIFEETPCEQSVKKWFLNEAKVLESEKEKDNKNENISTKVSEKLLLNAIDEIILTLATIKAQIQ